MGIIRWYLPSYPAIQMGSRLHREDPLKEQSIPEIEITLGFSENRLIQLITAVWEFFMGNTPNNSIPYDTTAMAQYLLQGQDTIVSEQLRKTTDQQLQAVFLAKRTISIRLSPDGLTYLEIR